MIWIEAELNQLDLEEYALLLIVLAGLCAYLLYVSYTSYQQFRHIHGTATSKIRSASQGYVELKGLGEWMPGDKMHTPFSQKRCLWYHCTIEKKERAGRRTSWTNILTRTSNQIFHLVDETGNCVIDPEDAHVVSENSQVWYGNNELEVSPPTAQRGSLLGRIGLGNYRFTEQIITPASEIYVLGLFKTIQKNISNESISASVEDLIRHWKIQPDRYLSNYDIDKNGVIQKNEWKMVRRDARKQILEKIEKESKPIHVISDTIESNSPFILSTISEERLTFQKRLISYSSIAAALLLFVAIVICINIRPFVF